MGIQNRKHPRRHVQQFGMILNSDGSVPVRCTMVDVSASGARLKLNATSEVPDEFTLVLSREGRVRRRCQIVWRREDMMGIRFLTLLTPAEYLSNS
jgi:PilZ domain-containing protein